MHGAVAWGMSMLLAAVIALFASGFAAFLRTPARAVAIFATGGALLSLIGALLKALSAASRESGIPLSNEFRLPRRNANGQHAPLARDSDVRRDETTILPPTH